MLQLLFLFFLPLKVLTSTYSHCTNGFTLVNGKCLRYFNLAYTHESAERACISFGATLVTINNAIDNRAIYNFLGSSSSNVWIGMYCYGNDLSKCVLDDSSGPSYSNFRPGHPTLTYGKCVSMERLGSEAGRWSSEDCETNEIPFVCELPPTVEDPCQFNFAGYCYNFINSVTFSEGEQQCADYCGSLASVHSANENRFITSRFLPTNQSSLLLGAERTSRNNFHWDDGSAWTFDNVDPYAPLIGNCVAISLGLQSDIPPGSWYSTPCSSNFTHAVCKRPAGSSCPGTPPPVTVTPLPSNPSNCNSTFLLAPGTITSPGFPSSYPNNQFCSYQLGTVGSYSLLLRFTSFNTEAGRDIVSVFDGDQDNGKSNLIGMFSGQLAPFSVYSEGNSMYVIFSSDQANNAQGFKATFCSYAYHR